MSTKNLRRWCVPLLVTSFLQACGGGGGDSAPPAPPPPAAPSGLSYPAHPAFAVNTAIAALSPTVTGTVTTYSVTPALPAGLAINATSGQISGTPTAVLAASNFQVTASNAGGQTTASVAITVNDVAPVITYTGASFTFTTGVAVAVLNPGNTGGAITQWSIDHALPAGMVFDSTNGQIRGTPMQATAASAFVVTAQNSGGSSTFNLNIGVRSGVLLDLGHASGIGSIRFAGTRILSSDGLQPVLWNALSGALITRFQGCLFDCIALAGNVAVVKSTIGFDVRQAADGAQVSVIPVAQVDSPWWILSSDGQFLCAGSPTALTCWSTSGTQLFTKAGDYRNAAAFGSAGELRVAKGAAGAQVIEKFSVPAGTSTLSPAFPGTFHSWFLDGERFITLAGQTATIYSKDVVQQDIAILSTVEHLAGQTNWFWTSAAGALRVHAVGSGGSSPTVFSHDTNSLIFPSTDTIGILEYLTSSFSVVNLSGATPVKSDYDTPVGHTASFASRTAGDWVFGTGSGVLMGELGSGTPQRYSLGSAASIAGNSVRTAVATASGSIFIFNSQSLALENEISGLEGLKLEISDDGTRLAAAPASSSYADDLTLRVYSLPSGTVITDWPSTSSSPDAMRDFSMSGSGTVVARTYGSGAVSWTRRVETIAHAPIWTDSIAPDTTQDRTPRLSPDGLRHAVSSANHNMGTGTDVYVNGVLSTAATGWAVGWLDDNRLLVNRFGVQNRGSIPYLGCSIINAAGQVLATPALPELNGFQRIGGTSLYSPELNLVLETATGNTLWSSAQPSRGMGAAAGNFVVFASGPTVRAEPR